MVLRIMFFYDFHSEIKCLFSQHSYSITHQKGEKVREKGERDTGKQGEMYYVTKLDRPPLSARASGLISVSGRSYIFGRPLQSFFMMLMLAGKAARV